MNPSYVYTLVDNILFWNKTGIPWYNAQTQMTPIASFSGSFLHKCINIKYTHMYVFLITLSSRFSAFRNIQHILLIILRMIVFSVVYFSTENKVVQNAVKLRTMKNANFMIFFWFFARLEPPDEKKPKQLPPLSLVFALVPLEMTPQTFKFFSWKCLFSWDTCLIPR